MAKRKYNSRKTKPKARKKAKRRVSRKKVVQKRSRSKSGQSAIAKKDAHGRAIHYCSIGRCAKRYIFGGSKGLATHNRRHHRK